MNRVYLYAFNEVSRVVDVKFLEGNAITVQAMRRTAQWMRDHLSPDPVVIYAVDNRHGLYGEFMEAVKSKDFRTRIEFADIISREGVLIK